MQLLLIAVWAVLLIGFMVLGPGRDSILFGGLLAAAMASGIGYMWLANRESRQTAAAAGAWLRRINELVDLRDYEDDGHLVEFLDAIERRRVIEELERMPRGARSLRQALLIVAPELVDEPGRRS